MPISSPRKNCNSNASLLISCKKAPFQVLFCGAHQTFTPPGIDSLRWVWYLTNTFISMREIIPIWISIS
ncbi:hypothetical protein FMJ37_07440 [Klebsiella michiganensis]|nr:hypothetical protein [Klebsiella michiganensis]MBZ7492436.1 hypothetical protein [Klebsiella michiganensis]